MKDERVVHGFFGRQGGVSSGLYESLNVGPGSSDDPAAIEQNRDSVRMAMGADALLSCYQVHGRNVVTVDAPWTERPEADAMVTATPGLALCILTADCVPILFADKQARIIGAAHAGWKGAVAGVAEATLDAMVALGATRSRIKAAIGPCIQQDSYEVGPDFRDAVLPETPWAANLFRPGDGDRLHFNLPVFVKNKLIKAGCAYVDLLPDDTCTLETRYFSNRRRNHRGEADYGRNASVILLR
ncbi:MAG: peptidoglycan editing factor PgeF [Pseudomonadota bacterium]